MPNLAKAYNAKDYEDSINRQWLESGFFNPDNLKVADNASSYTIILPPPNVTDRLHLGHASMLAIQDLLIRFHRMNGYRTLWLPGTDHAAIATQAVVEKKIYKEEGKTRHDLGREEFLRRVTAFAMENQTTIIEQIKAFGASLDWSRLAYTLDEPRQVAVRQMFVDMYRAGIIYRGERVVNWCPHCQTTLADDEVMYKTEKTILYTFKYWPDFPLEISSTRPETKLGDTAVAVNPKDERYQQYIGQELNGLFCGQPLSTKIISDREVDQSFGSGALGVTPAHSMTDWRMAEEHNLKIIKVINEEAKIREGFGPYSGLSVTEARAAIIKQLEEQHLITKQEEIEHNLLVCYRCDTAVEPLPSLQWFLAVDKPIEKLNGQSLKTKALEVSEQGLVAFTPTRFKKRYEDWTKNLRDWCISRQIVFGHQIPVWYRGGEIYVGIDAPAEEGWLQDTDTLDTWFSSGMWTFSTLGWPQTYQAHQKNSDLLKFHPTNVLETGYEIITLWVSRMIMMSLFALNEIPFKQVYLHGMILDADGKKMSKSKGNGIDPILVSEKYGNDAVRLSLLLGSTPGTDARLSEDKIASFRNFTNKLWNISRYILSEKSVAEVSTPSLADRWIISRLHTTIKHVTEKINQLDFTGAGEDLQNFTQDDLADWYIEASKFEPSTAPKLLPEILKTILKLWHPFMPFVTETIWQEAQLGDSLLLVTQWPEFDTDKSDIKIEQQFEIIQEVIRSIRNLRTEHRLNPGQNIKAILYTSDYIEVLKAAQPLIQSLRTGINDLEIKSEAVKPTKALLAVVGTIEIYLEVEINVEVEQERLNKEIIVTEKYIKTLEQTLNNSDFVSRAPATIIEKEKLKLHEAQLKLEKLSDQLKSLK